MKYSRFFVALAFLLFAGCAHVISEESMRLVDRSLSFAQLKENPDRYGGRYAILGGAIASVSNTKQMGQLEVVQFQLDSDNMPLESDISGGRFLAQTDGFLDPLVYKPGRLVTIVGEVKGHKPMQLDQVEYDYPIIAMREIYLWKPPEARTYMYPSPYYDDFWRRPYRPWHPWWQGSVALFSQKCPPGDSAGGLFLGAWDRRLCEHPLSSSPLGVAAYGLEPGYPVPGPPTLLH